MVFRDALEQIKLEDRYGHKESEQLFLPKAGLLSYFVFGRELNNSQWNKSVLKKTKKISTEQNELFEQGKLFNKELNPKKYSRMAGMNLQCTVSPLTQGNDLQFLTNSHEKMHMIFREVTNAEKSLYVQYFSLEKDKTGEQFLLLPKDKAAEGIEVFLLIDGLGSMDLKEKDLSPLKRAGGQKEIFFPFRTIFHKAALNHRNHN